MNTISTPGTTVNKDISRSFVSKEIEPRAAILDEASHDEVAKLIKENIKKMAGKSAIWA